MKRFFEICHHGGDIAIVIDPLKVAAIDHEWQNHVTHFHMEGGQMFTVRGYALGPFMEAMRYEKLGHEHGAVEVYALPPAESYES